MVANQCPQSTSMRGRTTKMECEEMQQYEKILINVWSSGGKGKCIKEYDDMLYTLVASDV